MGKWNFLEIISKEEEDDIHRSTLRVLDEIGFTVENREILERLERYGGRADYPSSRIFFSPKFMERFIASSEKHNWNLVKPHVSGAVSIFHGYYLDPETDRYSPWNEENLLDYIKVARNIGLDMGVFYAPLIGGVPEKNLIPFTHYLAAKFFGKPCSSINSVDWAPFLLEFYLAYAEEIGTPLNDLISHLHIHFVPPLKFTSLEAEIFLFFAKNNLRIGIGCMDVMGTTSPVTIAGSIAMHLAQVLVRNIIFRVFFNDMRIFISCEISPIDMKTLMQCYGRPEKELCNIVMAQMARRYGASFWPHTGYTDAKNSGCESGVQRMINSLPSLFASGTASICCGVLSVDEGFSPVQQALDREAVGILKRFASGLSVSDETLAFDAIKEVMSGGNFVSSEHTALNYRKEQWEPSVFTREMLNVWQEKGSRNEIDRARDICMDALKGKPLEPCVSERLENKLLDIIRKNTGLRILPIEPR